ncbi:MAG: LptA/OstA family protein [Armatimonadota bacterium]|nr:LptA/OstA family protein [Armatimonadota bacterium]
MAGRRRAAGAGLVALLALSGGAPAGSAPAAAVRVVQITADEITVDATTGDGAASGRVRVTDGQTTATADRARLARREGQVVLTGAARVVAPQGALAAREITVTFTRQAITRLVARGQASLEAEEMRLQAPGITIVPAREEVAADGGVALAVPPDVTARGQRFAYQRVGGQMLLDGDVRVVTRDGVLEGTRLDGDRRLRRLQMQGPVRATYGEILVHSQAAAVDGQERVAVFTGQVRATQPGRWLTTDRLTVWYAQRRMRADGPTRIHVDPQP